MAMPYNHVIDKMTVFHLFLSLRLARKFVFCMAICSYTCLLAISIFTYTDNVHILMRNLDLSINKKV